MPSMSHVVSTMTIMLLTASRRSGGCIVEASRECLTRVRCCCRTEWRDPMEKVFEIYIRTTPERLWEAITDPEIRSKYQFGNRISSDFTPGSRFEMTHEGAPGPLGEGENLEVDPPRRLVQSMVALWSDDVKSEGTSRITWQIEPVGDSCHLSVTHDELAQGANAQLYGGWPMILSGLKTWLETGELLTTPGSLMYGLS